MHLTILIWLGNFDTEVGVLTQPSMRECFRAAGLVSRDSDTPQDYQRDVTNLLRRYILEQVVYLTNSMRSTQRFIIAAKQVFLDAILLNELAMDGLPACQISVIVQNQQEENMQYWVTKKASQLDSCYSELGNTQGIPTREEVESVTRYSILNWNPTESLVQYENQSDQSFAEQTLAVRLATSQIDKFMNPMSLTCAKNPLISGKPGAGKTFVGQIVVLYCLSRGLNVLTTALQAARASALGGLHVHNFFPIPPTNRSQTPYLMAQEAIRKLENKPEDLYAVRTLDVLFIDEAEQISNEQLRAIDIILRKEKDSQNPFGGVLIVGSMDPCQLHPINQLPFLTSSLMVTSFVMVQMRHSVRAHGQPAFQRLQDITRMNPGYLLANPQIKEEFFLLAGGDPRDPNDNGILTFADSWSDDKISPGMMRAYSRRIPVQDALAVYMQDLRSKLERDGTPFRTRTSIDTQRIDGSNAKWSKATHNSIASLNKELREPKEILLVCGGLYELTQNDREGNFCQSQIVMLLDLPSEETLANFGAFPGWVSPSGCQRIDYNVNNIPDRDELVSMGWREVSVGVAPQRPVRVRGGILAQRAQYALKHIGAITIDRPLGLTLPAGIAVEISSNYSPWNKEQIVVVTSRTNVAEMTVIVGEKQYAIQKMWELITCANQWTKYMECVSNVILINVDKEEAQVFDIPRVYPFKVVNFGLPSDNTGYVYCLVSRKDHGEIYIGTTENIAQRLKKHNSAKGGPRGTANPNLGPWAVASYICGLAHMNAGERISIEHEWQRRVEQQASATTFVWISIGQNIVTEYNAMVPDEGDKIRFVRTIEPVTLSTE